MFLLLLLRNWIELRSILLFQTLCQSLASQGGLCIPADSHSPRFQSLAFLNLQLFLLDSEKNNFQAVGQLFKLELPWSERGGISRFAWDLLLRVLGDAWEDLGSLLMHFVVPKVVLLFCVLGILTVVSTSILVEVSKLIRDLPSGIAMKSVEVEIV